MTLDRRTFLSWLGAAGMTAVVAPRLVGRARADEPVTGPFFLFVHAGGGWDPTLLCDPKGRANELDPAPVNMYGIDEIGEVGPFRFAPLEGHREFFERFRNDLLVLNGVDTQTNSHELGTRFTWSGSATPGVPALAALVAGARDPRPTLAFLSNGGYDVTDGIVAPTRLPDSSAILGIAYPERLDEDDPESNLFPLDVSARLDAARSERLQRLLDRSTLPRVSAKVRSLQLARSGDTDLARLAEFIPEDLDDSNNPLRRQAQVAIACFAAGVSVTATMEIGGFDTHGDHDASHAGPMRRIVDGVTFAMDEAERAGIADKVVIVVGSDFARTPFYNMTNGKDHWSITSMMMMGPGIRGGRVIGATDERQAPILLDPTSLQPSEDGIRITPGHVHAALRQLAGIDAWETAARYPVGASLGLLA